MKVKHNWLVNLSKQARKSKDRETDQKLKENLSNYKTKSESKILFYGSEINSAIIAKALWGIINSALGIKNVNT